MDKLKLAISTCPNDTFIFGALIRKDIGSLLSFTVLLFFAWFDLVFLYSWYKGSFSWKYWSNAVW